ncbi:MAG: hypothetical protein FJ086_14845, partial [Deltaproteobacteria bacterium]|nr:hypothetical protein [Deltaproteobacteria bacterium]
PAGAHCPHGGQKVTATAPGATTTAYVCNGAASRTSLTPEPPGPNCPAGGFKAVSYVDANNNGQPDPAELTAASTQYVCNGESPTQPCTGPYEALQWDGTAWQCVQVNATGPSGGRARGFEVMDSWGTAWDGVERPAATWTDAKASCQAVGGRLPTATEVWRVGASQSSEVGTSYESNWLWTLTPWHVNGATQQHTQGRLNDAGGDTAISYAADSTKTPYRCVWPVAAAQGFQGSRCHGPPSAPCFQSVGEGRRRNLDASDRPSLTYAGATWECAFAGAHLPLSLSLAENIPNGLPNGSGAFLWTADHARYDLVDVVKWTGTNPAGWNATYPVSWSWAARDINYRYRFRCMGEGSGLLPNTGGVPADTATWGDPFTGQGTGLAGHGLNLAPATWEDAVQDCFSRGGQLPHTRDWMELIRDGLPNGAGPANEWAWSSDWSNQSKVQVVRWAGTDRAFTGYYSQYAAWSALGAQTFPYRCTWYPVDAAYAGPGLCSGGQLDCHLSEKPAGTATVRTWADPVDRAPATWVNAVKTCAAEGGHLASMREYVALVRDGLPNGQGPASWTWSSDSEGGAATNPAVAGLFKWGGGANGTQTDWNTALGYQDWAYRDAPTAHGYRCVWTNQVW